MTAEDIVVGLWGARFMNRRFPCTLGRSGVTARKREGDGATPEGVHRIVGMLYRPDRLMQPADWALPIGPSDLWSDDPTDEDYNLMVRAPHAFSHERLRRADPMYDLILITDWNWPQSVPGARIGYLCAHLAQACGENRRLRGLFTGRSFVDRSAYHASDQTDRKGLKPGAEPLSKTLWTL